MQRWDNSAHSLDFPATINRIFVNSRSMIFNQNSRTIVFGTDRYVVASPSLILFWRSSERFLDKGNTDGSRRYICSDVGRLITR